MSDTRRRRKSNQSCGSDDLSDSYEELNATKETQSSEQTDGHQDSECDVYVTDSDAESQEGALRESGDGQEEEKPQKQLDDDEDRRNPQYIPKRGTFYEHDDRTTDEVTDNNTETTNERETKEKKVWKDKEDRWDHDRYNDEEQAPKSHEELIAVYGYDIRNEEGPPRARRRRRYGRGPNKYTRNWEDEDAYGKTTTNTAAKSNNKKFNRSGEDFPALGTNKNSPTTVEEPVISSAWYNSKSKTVNKTQNFPPLQPQHDGQKTKPSGASSGHTNENKAPNESNSPAWKKDGKHGAHNQNANGNSGSSGDTEKSVEAKAPPRDSNKRNVQEPGSLGTGRTRGRGFKANANNNILSNRVAENKPKGRGAGPITSENRRSNTIHHDDEHQITHDMKHVNINDGTQYHQGGKHNKSYYAQSPGQQRPNTVPPRMQQQQSHQQQSQQGHQQQQTIQQQQQQQDGSGNRPKRYSSLRQRPAIPETPTQQNYQPPHGQHAQHAQHGQHTQHAQHGQHAQHAQHGQHGQHGYFTPQAGNSRGVLDSQGYPQGHFEQTPPVAAPAAPMAGQPVIPLPPNGQPASYAPPPFLVPPPQFIPPQTAPPSIINYVPGPNGPAFQPNFQGYQGFTPPVQAQGPPPPQELFAPQGCTYYSPAQQQQTQQQAAPVRRPKAAIPILPPPDNQQHSSSRGRGRIIQANQQTNQPGIVQQSEQEVNRNSVESDQKTVPGQFENVQNDQLETIQQKQDNISITSSNIGNEENIAKNTDEVDASIETSVITMDKIEDTSNKEILEAVEDNKSVITSKSIQLDIGKTDSEPPKLETTVPETSVVEEAVA